MFWQIIIVLSAIAVLFILWPLIQLPFLHKSWVRHASRDETQLSLYHEHIADIDRALAGGEIGQEEYDQLKVELQKTLVADEVTAREGDLNRKGKLVVFGVAVLVPVICALLYNQWGAKQDWDIYQEVEQLPLIESNEAYEQKLRTLVLKAQARLNQTPDNVALRNLLAEISMGLQDYDEAVANYRKILEVVPDSPRIMANLAQALFYRAGNTITPEVREYTQKALTIAPNLPEMLGLAGIDAQNQGDLRGAIRYWKRAVAVLNPNSSAARGYQNGIARAEQALRDAGQPLEEPQAAEGEARSVTVNVSLGPDVKVAPDAAVFVYARAWEGPKMPLSIQKLSVSDLPKTVRLDESMAMAPGMTLASFPKVELVARVSLAGSAIAQSGDWQASLGPVTLDEVQEPFSLTIDEQLP